jgi:hypothetical protein
MSGPGIYPGQRGEPSLPLSKVLAEANGSTIYSREVNRSLCAATDSQTQRTWLGNALGLKLVDARANTVFHYGERDGLPQGSVVAIGAAASGEAWCVVEGRPDQDAVQKNPVGGTAAFRLCAFRPSDGKWKLLRTITPAANAYNRGDAGYSGGYPYEGNREFLQQAGRPRIAVGPDSVIFTIGMMGASDEAAAYRWDRRTKSLEPLPWDAGLRADNRSLFSTFVATDARDGGLWLGTNAGLLYRAGTRGKTADASWTRVLPDQIIGEGAAAVRDGGVWVVTMPRPTNESPYGSPAQNQAWKLFRVAGATAGQVREETPPAPPDETANGVPTMPRPFPPAGPNRSVPVAVTTDERGALWLTQMGTGSRDMGFGRGALDAWWQRDAGASAWARFEMRAPGGPGFGMLQSPVLHQTTASGEQHNSVSQSLLPDAAVRPLALSPRNTIRYGYAVASGGYTVGGTPEDARTVYWLRRRFPAWICPDDLKDTPGDPLVLDPARRASASPYGLHPDPYGAEGMVWLMDRMGTTLLQGPRTALPEEIVRSRSRGYYQASPGDDPLTNPKIEKYPLPAGSTIQVRPSVDAMAAGATGLFLAIQSRDLYAFNSKDGTFTRVPLPRSGMFPTRYNPPVAGRDGEVILSSPNSSESQVVSFRPKEGSFRTLTDPGTNRRVFAVAPNGGLWIVGNPSPVLFQPPGAAEATPLPVTGTEPRRGTPLAAAATGYIGWYSSDGNTLFGYDIERRRATPTIDVRKQQGYDSRQLKVVTDGRGGAYVASENGTASVYHYDREKNAWEIAAPPLPAIAPTPNDSSIHLAPVLVAGGDREFWVLADARYLIRYDRRKKAWGAPVPLPQPLRGGSSSDSDQSVAVAEGGNAFYIAGRGGLWRYGPRENRWTEKTMTVKIPAPEQNTGMASNGARLTALAFTPESVFTVWNLNNGGANFAARLDRRTKKWSLYDESRGFPERNMGMRLVGTGSGSGAWLIQGSETYFFDAKADLWRLAFGSPSDRAPQIGERIPPAALAKGRVTQADDTGDYRVADIVSDPGTGDSFVLATPQTYTPESRSVVFRCDGTGRIIARAAAPTPLSQLGPTGYSLLADQGGVLIASSKGVYRAFGAASAAWSPVAPPDGFTLPATVTRLQRGKDDRGLYVMNNDTVAYWVR